jgi:glycine betaine/choline ABC-type transport system substrate-binding protein
MNIFKCIYLYVFCSVSQVLVTIVTIIILERKRKLKLPINRSIKTEEVIIEEIIGKVIFSDNLKENFLSSSSSSILR